MIFRQSHVGREFSTRTGEPLAEVRGSNEDIAHSAIAEKSRPASDLAAGAAKHSNGRSGFPAFGLPSAKGKPAGNYSASFGFSYSDTSRNALISYAR
jgi:hypothetical protein